MVQAKPRAAGVEDVQVELPVLWLPDGLELTDELLLQLSCANELWRFERTADGALAMTLPGGRRSGRVQGELYAQVLRWEQSGGGGETHDASVGCRLPDSSILEPDAAWVDDAHAATLAADGFLSGAPAFVLEVRSPRDSVALQQRKMELWMANGVRLGWLVDPIEEVVWVYRTGRDAERIERPGTLGGEDVMQGFEASFERIWKKPDA